MRERAVCTILNPDITLGVILRDHVLELFDRRIKSVESRLPELRASYKRLLAQGYNPQDFSVYWSNYVSALKHFRSHLATLDYSDVGGPDSLLGD